MISCVLSYYEYLFLIFLNVKNISIFGIEFALKELATPVKCTLAGI